MVAQISEKTHMRWQRQELGLERSFIWRSGNVYLNVKRGLGFELTIIVALTLIVDCFFFSFIRIDFIIVVLYTSFCLLYLCNECVT